MYFLPWLHLVLHFKLAAGRWDFDMVLCFQAQRADNTLSINNKPLLRSNHACNSRLWWLLSYQWFGNDVRRRLHDDRCSSLLSGHEPGRPNHWKISSLNGRSGSSIGAWSLDFVFIKVQWPPTPRQIPTTKYWIRFQLLPNKQPKLIFRQQC